ncbi:MULTISPECIES: DNA polymerase IV [unclassified Flavonifractor]|uniref:DNA polymerase IV n=1 Tax=unclassified Flavonifractor TaxID=2629267 RepID=UPI000B3A8783|nr:MULTISPECIES: DNA polymerase IV [unclassified Flavonifractor]OUN10329.1 DNA polymerase IV [Flavonifractor sp. An9]OUN14134.1 DNA polymerase IV [Flavonifractor sp. An91]OUN81913.1 DNA polymerase IV [Flavonifractor sp. An52]OUO17946.1 DNA polymerase IV [Flavonifractor sp. An4]
MDRVIFHCDLNSFYASVELLDHPELKDRPAAVCGDPESRHGIILAKNELAKKYKVQTAETIWQARRKCPDLVLLPAHHWKYREYSKKVNAIYERYTDLVEPFSIDESWLDVTGTLHLFGGDGKALADQIRQTVRQELGLTVSVGVSFNKVFAKMGSDYRKPDATTVITRENFQQLLWPLPVTDLLFVGRAAARVLNGYGIRTIGDLARFDRESLGQILGKGGYTLHDYATGREHAPVVPARDMPGPKSVGNGLTFPKNLVGWEQLRTALSELADEVAVRLRKHGLKCTTVQITVRDPSFKDICRQKRLSAPTYISRDLAQCGMELLHSCWSERQPVRALTITAQNLVEERDAGEQVDLFAADAIPCRDKLEKLEKAMDSIRDKYGRGAISIASAVHPAGEPDREDQRLPPGD